jgi:hypothetical protein
VRHIVESLEQALDLMEEVQRLVELAEQQKIGDEREIENLRRMLRRIQPPRNEPQRSERRYEPRREPPAREEISREPHERGELPPPEESDLRPLRESSSDEPEVSGSEEQGS